MLYLLIRVESDINDCDIQQDQQLYADLYSGRVKALEELLTALAAGQLPLLARIDWGVYGLPARGELPPALLARVW